MEDREDASAPSEPQRQEQQQEREKEQYDTVSLLRQRAAARHERLLKRQSQRLHLLQGYSSEGGFREDSTSNDIRLPPTDRPTEAASRLSSSDTSDTSTSSPDGQVYRFLNVFSVFLGVGAGVNTLLRDSASPQYLFEALGFSCGPLSWTALCYICGLCLYLPLPLLLLLSVAELLQHRGSRLKELWKATAKLALGPRRAALGLALPHTITSVQWLLAALRPLLMRFVFFIISFCIAIAILRTASAAAGCCPQQQ